jgi:hypothetical protein
LGTRLISVLKRIDEGQMGWGVENRNWKREKRKGKRKKEKERI